MNGELPAAILGNPPGRWAVAVVVALLAALALALLLRFARVRLSGWARETDAALDDGLAAALRATRSWFVLSCGALAGALTLALPARVASTAGRLLVVVLLLQAGLWLHAGIGGWLQGYMDRHRDPARAGAATTTTVLAFVARLLLWSLVVLMLLANAGVDVTALVASLGIGGVAVALAAQNILGDMFASLAIALDQPVAIGDFIVMGDTMGTVERVGLKTTHLRSLSGELVVLSNTDLIASRIRNYKRMSDRRAVFSFNVEYGTAADLVERIPALVREVVEEQPHARFDRSHFKSLAGDALQFETVYFMRVTDFGTYMDTQQAINLALYRRFTELGVRLAHPSQRLVIDPGSAAPVLAEGLGQSS